MQAKEKGVDFQKMIKKILKNREQMAYLVCGGLTTLVNFLIFISLDHHHVELGVNNTLSFVGAVLFAYFVNSRYVFLREKKKNFAGTIMEIGKFFGARMASFLIETALLYFAVSLGSLAILAKMIVSVITLLLNYIFSKFLVFK